MADSEAKRDGENLLNVLLNNEIAERRLKRHVVCFVWKALVLLHAKKGLILQGLSEPFVLKMKLGQETLLIREYVPNVQEIAKTFVFIMTDL